MLLCVCNNHVCFYYLILPCKSVHVEFGDISRLFVNNSNDNFQNVQVWFLFQGLQFNWDFLVLLATHLHIYNPIK